MKIVGRCHCGDITYAAAIDPGEVTICHCTDCQTLTGSAFRTDIPVSREAFEPRTGKPKIYLKAAESGVPRVQAFRPDCGTPIYSAAVGDASAFMVHVGAARQSSELEPRKQLWCRSALDWVMDPKSVRQTARQTP